jgi:hypothetical protein
MQKSFVEVLESIRARASKGPLCLADFVAELGDQQHGFLLLHLSLPFMLPIPLPGLSAVFGLIIAAVMFSWMLQKKAWVPGILASKELPLIVVDKVPEFVLKALKHLWFVRPRLTVLFDSFLCRCFLGLITIFAALILALPLPPGTNFPPALVIALMALAMVTRDGAIALVALLVFGIEVYLVSELIHLVFEWLPQWLPAYFTT